MLTFDSVRTKMLWLLLAIFLVGGVVPRATNARSCGPPPPAKPQRRKAGESFPPLPLPATPLRRTEKKRQPAPPALVGKLEYGKIVWATTPDGRRYSYRDWTTDPGDMEMLLNWVYNQLGIRYRPIRTSFGKFSFNPAEIPILYLTGHEGFQFTNKQALELRQYILDGGYLLADACCGSEDFVKSFVIEAAHIFPDRPLHILSQDHPVYQCFYTITNVAYQDEKRGRYSAPPQLMGIDIGCRTAVFFTPNDLSCGWAGHTHPWGTRVLPNDARRLGANIVTYCLANYQLGRFLSTQKLYYQEAEKTRDEFVFGQVVHQGDWDPSPSAPVELLKYVAANTTIDVQFKRVPVDLRKTDAFGFPLLYMTGHRDFKLSDVEVQNLRRYLTNGGILLADACCGREAFDRAFRREIAKVFPERKLTPIPLEHPIFHSRYEIKSVTYTPYALHFKPNLTQPTFEGISLMGDDLAVIYSPYMLGSAWDGCERPYAKGYATRDALKLGMNILVYAMTH